MDYEAERIKLLHQLDLLDTPADPNFDRITRLVSTTLKVPIALVNFVDSHRQWYKSRIGVDVSEAPRKASFCTVATANNAPLIVDDATIDARFSGSPFVTQAPHVRFYAGIPLRTLEGYAIGTLCAIDNRPRHLSNEELNILQDLAAVLSREIQIREAACKATAYIHLSDKRLEASEDRFKHVFAQAGTGIGLLSPAGKWLDANRALCDIVGYSDAELADMTFQDITPDEELDDALALFKKLTGGELEEYQTEKHYLQKHGDKVWINVKVTKQVNDAGEIDYLIAIIENIQARKQAEESLAALWRDLETKVEERTLALSKTNTRLAHVLADQVQSEQTLRKQEAELRSILENASDAYIRIDQRGVITEWNRAAEDTLGWSRSEALGQLVENLIIPEHLRASHRAGMKRYLNSGVSTVLGQRLEVSARRKDDTLIPIELRISALASDGQKTFNAFLHDITDRKLAEEQREREALHDALTGLPNRRALQERLPQAMARVARNKHALGLLFLDLNGFKAVNDTHGHEAGDTLLKEIAWRLQQNVRKTDGVFRLAGDEFTVVLEDIINHGADAEMVANKLLNAIKQPIHIGAATVQVSTSIGITLHDENDKRSAHQLLIDADKAMYEAKQTGRGIVSFLPGYDKE